MRQVVLDTETTGLEPEQGHRIIEIGCVELVNRRFSDRRFHYYLCPDREIDPGALQVHGITAEFLKGQPRFEDVVDDLLEFLREAELVIHNAAFDIGFLDNELSLLSEPRGRVADHCSVLDTLSLARELHPGQRNSLEALCKRYHVDDSQRTLHGALLDAEILAEVYLAMTGGQASLPLASSTSTRNKRGHARADTAGERAALPVIRASAEELQAHRACLERIDEASGGRCVWLALGADETHGHGALATPGVAKTGVGQ